MLQRFFTKQEKQEIIPTAAPQATWSLDQWVVAWLAEKSGRTQSERTEEAYKDVIGTFREQLRANNGDLDSPAPIVSVLAQGFAARTKKGTQTSAATYNQRLAILSSFYRYVLKRGGTEHIKENPITPLERRPVDPYAGAVPMEAEILVEKLEAIDRGSPLGLRDYALLSIAVTTGRRRNELRTLCLGHLKQRSDGRIIIHFARLKGAKTRDDELPEEVTEALLAWLTWLYPEPSEWTPDKPLWVALDKNPEHTTKRQMLTHQSLHDLYMKRLGTSQTHVGRNTFAYEMENSGAKVSEIQYRLAHTNLATTSRYLGKLHPQANPHAATLVSRFGIGRKKEK